MESILKNLFDTYSRKARLEPTLLTLLPLLAVVYLWVPSLFDLATTIVTIFASFGVITLLVSWTRTRGRDAEKELFRAWGGKPTTVWLRHSDSNLDPNTKARYCSFLEANVNSWRTPTPEDEKVDSATADGRYDSAVKWLLEHTRDTKQYPLIFKENISYGFRRNLYAMKPFGITLCFLALACNVLLWYTTTIDQLQATILMFISAGIICLLGFWLLVVNEQWVKDNADAYARALLSSCDTHHT